MKRIIRLGKNEIISMTILKKRKGIYVVRDKWPLPLSENLPLDVWIKFTRQKK